MPKRTSQNEEVNDDGTGGVYDRQAITYASVRPDYPDQVFSTIAQYTNLRRRGTRARDRIRRWTGHRRHGGSGLAHRCSHR